MNCKHPYSRKLGPDKLVCLDCGAIYPVATKKPTGEVICMPPRIYEIDQYLWKSIAPWPLMPFDVVRKYEWYVSYIYGAQYLVMPVLKDNKPVFYSARLLKQNEDTMQNKPKYATPEGIGKTYWTSGKLGRTVFFAEGIADAAYLSLLDSSVAVLGSYYNGTLDPLLKGKRIIVVMDGDVKGIEAAFRLIQHLKKHGILNVNNVTLPPGKDPTDLKKEQLRRIISTQIGGY